MELIAHDEEHAQTYRMPWLDRDVVVKKCDIRNECQVMKELEHEANVYLALQSLQGHRIPMLWMVGIADGLEMVLVMDFVGNDICHEHLDASDRFQIRVALSAIHRLGVLHDDIRPHNIATKHDSPNSQFFFIDFEIHKRHNGPGARER